MEGIVFVPGIFGSELYYNNNNGSSEIWPPGPFDLLGYTQISELSDPTRVSVGDIIDYIGLPIFPVYSTIRATSQIFAIKSTVPTMVLIWPSPMIGASIYSLPRTILSSK
jgi:hypothetical protein